jgi:predicted nucleic acid-binding protein
MSRVFIDSDIILDVLAERKPFYEPAAKLFTLMDEGDVSGFTSPIVFANIHYILSKMTSKAYALQSLRKLKSLISILSTDENIIELALESSFIDFEDAIQYYTAKSHEINFIITRNKRHYKKSRISVCDAGEYVDIWVSRMGQAE